ncbi:hypothetical protein MRX96_057551 [Rhipicephalus microplus]
MKMPFLMQVVLLGFISTTSCVFRLPESPPGLPPAYLTNKPPLLFADENDKCQAEPDPPPSVADHFIAWQLRTSTSAAALQKPPSPGCQLGHATALNAIMKMPFPMQVVLLGFISTTSCVFGLPESPPGLPPAYLTNKPPLLFADENDKCQAEPDPPPSVADHFIAWQLWTSTSAAALQKPPSPGCQLGHATALNAIMKMPFLMQVVLLGFISTTSCVFRLPESPPGLPPAYLTNKPPLLFADENDKCQAEPDPPPSVADHFIAWQLRTSTSAAALQKPPSPGCQLGHATASNAIMKMPFLMQVVLLGFISTTSCVFRLPESPPGLPPAYLTNKPPLLFADENDKSFAKIVHNIAANEEDVMAYFAVKSLFTSVPLNLAIPTEREVPLADKTFAERIPSEVAPLYESLEFR